MKKLLSLLALVASASLLTACATLPRIQSNQVGPEIQTDSENDTLYYSPSGPFKDANQEQLISGFLYAGNGPQDDYAVAREYLTGNFTARWNPSAETLIQNGQTKVLSNSGTRVRVLVPYDARIEADGTYVSTPGSERVLEFKLLQVGGEWRLAAAPNLTVLLRPNFSVLFQPVSAFFWDRSFTYLVPEVRWFPTKAAIATRLTNALLAGPSSWLEPAVQNIVPVGTKLNINSVTVSNGNAQVDLSATALKIPAWKRPYLRSQLLASLSEISGVSQVTISVERTVQEIPVGSSGITATPSNLPVVMNEDGLSHIAGSSLFGIVGTKELVKMTSAKTFTLSNDESVLALLGPAGVHAFNLGLIGVKDQLVDSRDNLIRPTIDPFNQIWTMSETKGASFRVTDTSGIMYSLASPFGKEESITAIAMSPEGSRLAVVHTLGKGSVVDILPIIRDKSRKVVGFASPYRLSSFTKATQSISWVDSVTLAGLQADAQGNQEMVTVLIGGAASNGRVTTAGVYVVSTVGGSHDYLDKNGDLFASKTFGWVKTLSGVLALGLAGQ